MFLSESPSGIYYLYYSDILGKRKKVSTRHILKTDALKFLQSFDAEEERKRATRKTAFLQPFIIDFLSSAVGNYSKNTVTIYRSALNRSMSIAGNVPLDSKTAQQLDNYVDWSRSGTEVEWRNGSVTPRFEFNRRRPAEY